MFHKPIRYLIWLVMIVLTSILVLFSKWSLWLIDTRAFFVPAIFGAIWWVIECGHVLFNFGGAVTNSTEVEEERWFWLKNTTKVASKLANDVTLMDSAPPWKWEEISEVFDVLGRVQTGFAFLAITCLIVMVIITKVMRLPMPLGDAIKMIGGVGILKEAARFGYRAVTGSWFFWYIIANILGRKAATRDSTVKPLSTLEQYYIKIHEAYIKYENIVDVLANDKHTKLFRMFQQLALTERGTYWIVLLVLAIMSVTTLLNHKPPKNPPPEPEPNTCCDLVDGNDEDEGNDNPPEGLYTNALKANAKWSLESGIEFVKQMLYPVAYMLIGVATYAIPMVLLLYCSNNWSAMTGKTWDIVAKDIWGGVLGACIALGVAMFVMNFLRYTEQFNSMLDYVVAHIFVVVFAFVLWAVMTG